MSIPFDFNPLGFSKNGIPNDYIAYISCKSKSETAETGQTLTYSSNVTSSDFVNYGGIDCFYTTGDKYIRLTENSINQGSALPRSYSCWFAQTSFSPGSQRGIAIGKFSGGKQLTSPNNAGWGNPRICAYGYGMDVNTNYSAPEKKWINIVVTYSASHQYNMYINGNLIYTGTSTEIDINSNVFSLGCPTNSTRNAYNGYIAAARLYNRVLTQAEAIALFNQLTIQYKIQANDQTFNFYQKNEGFKIQCSSAYTPTYQIMSGTLPSSISFNTSSGQFYGKGLTDADHVYNLVVKITAENSTPAIINVTLNTYKTARISITSKTFNFYTDGSQNDAFNYTADQNVTFTAETQLPNGLTLSGNRFYSDGTTTVGSYSIVVKGVSANNQTGVTATMTVVINVNVITIKTSSLKFFVSRGTTTKQILYETNKHSITPDYSYSGILPAGITFNSSTGQFTSDGTQTSATMSNITVSVASSTGYSQQASKSIDLIIQMQPPAIPDDYIAYISCESKSDIAETGQPLIYSPQVTEDNFEIYKGIPSFHTNAGDWSHQQYIRLTENSINQGPNSPRSYSCWFAQESFYTGYQRGIAIGRFGGRQQLTSPNNQDYGSIGGAKNLGAYGHSIDIGTPYQIQLHNWYHVCMTYSASHQYKLYVNGALVYSNNQYSININNYIFSLGAPTSSQQNCYDGYIAAARLYNRVLTEEQINALVEQFVIS